MWKPVFGAVPRYAREWWHVGVHEEHVAIVYHHPEAWTPQVFSWCHLECLSFGYFMSFGMPWHLGAFCVRYIYKILFSYAYFGCWPFLTYPCASSKRYSGCSSWKSSKFLTFKRLWYLKLIYGIGFWMLEINILKISDQILVLLHWCLVKILVLENVLNAFQIFFRQWQNLRIPENHLDKEMRNDTTNLIILWRNRENPWKYPFRYKDNKGLWEYLNILG